MNSYNTNSNKSVRFYIVLIIMLFFMACDYQREETKLKVSFTRSGDIYVMDEDGSNTKQLTMFGTNDYSSWSPDGDKIVFHSNRDGNDEIFIMNADGGDQIQLTNTLAPVFNRYPTFTLDGNSIIYLEYINPNYSFKIISLDGTLLKQFAAPSSPLGISVSPDGKSFIDTDGAGWISQISMETGLLVQLTSPSYLSPSWSSDGTFIIVRDSSFNIRIIDMALTIPIVPVVIYTNSSPITGLALSPDSKTIIFAKTPNSPGVDGLYTISKNGTDLRQLTVSPDLVYPDSNPCYQFKPR